jgi:hypothetical protein
VAFSGVRIIYECTPFLGDFNIPTCISTRFSGVGFLFLPTHFPTFCGPWAATQVFIEHDHRYIFLIS